MDLATARSTMRRVDRMMDAVGRWARSPLGLNVLIFSGMVALGGIAWALGNVYGR